MTRYVMAPQAEGFSERTFPDFATAITEALRISDRAGCQVLVTHGPVEWTVRPFTEEKPARLQVRFTRRGA